MNKLLFNREEARWWKSIRDWWRKKKIFSGSVNGRRKNLNYIVII